MVVSSTSLMGRLNKWTEGAVRTELRQVHVEVEEETLKNLGLVTPIKKKIGRYYTLESQILLSDQSIVSAELRKRL